MYICTRCVHLYACTHTYMNVSTQNTLNRHMSAVAVWTLLCAHSPYRKLTSQFSVVSEASVLHCIGIPSLRERQLVCIHHPYQMPLETGNCHSVSVGDPAQRDVGTTVSSGHNAAEKGVGPLPTAVTTVITAPSHD